MRCPIFRRGHGWMRFYNPCAGGSAAREFCDCGPRSAHDPAVSTARRTRASLACSRPARISQTQIATRTSASARASGAMSATEGEASRDTVLPGSTVYSPASSSHRCAVSVACGSDVGYPVGRGRSMRSLEGGLTGPLDCFPGAAFPPVPVMPVCAGGSLAGKLSPIVPVRTTIRLAGLVAFFPVHARSPVALLAGYIPGCLRRCGRFLHATGRRISHLPIRPESLI